MQKEASYIDKEADGVLFCVMKLEKNYRTVIHLYYYEALLNMTDGFECEETRTYAVIAIRNSDGTPLSLMEGMPVQMAPVFEGCMPFQSWAILKFSARVSKERGFSIICLITRISRFFADRTVSIAVFEGAMFPGPEIFSVDEDGKIIYADGYEGFRGMFELPLDESKADPEAAAALLGSY